MSNMKAHFYCLNMKKKAFFSFFLYFFSFVYCIDYFTEGKKLLADDRPEQAAAALFAASKEPGTPPSVYLYLGVAYFRCGKYTEALSYLSMGRKSDSINSYLYSYNIGNIYFLQSRYDAAEQAYNDSIAANGLYAPSFLNRANSRIKLDKHEGALQDYKIYLNLEPDTVQRPSIQKMIALLESAKEEALKAQALAEAKKAAEEAERRAAEERYRQLMNEVNSNLSSVDDANAVSAGAENTINYSEENELD
ncbi:tetratricopeptide repeat protein [Treponema pedis]|uniref:tetratricopeptide repeat protein n=1 Tax=Treponema pedis TaxID=409322 RepID=UPI001CEF5A2A|nr:tetratricopeptide repeat protein [Treponema pedis]